MFPSHDTRHGRTGAHWKKRIFRYSEHSRTTLGARGLRICALGTGTCTLALHVPQVHRGEDDEQKELRRPKCTGHTALPPSLWTLRSATLAPARCSARPLQRKARRQVRKRKGAAEVARTNLSSSYLTPRARRVVVLLDATLSSLSLFPQTELS